MADPEEWAIKDKKTREYFIELTKSKNIYFYLCFVQPTYNFEIIYKE